MFCPRCRDEFRQGFTRCHECDVALVESLDATNPHPTDLPDPKPLDPASGTRERPESVALVTVGRYFNSFEAQTNRMALEQAGLQAWLSDENLGATYGVAVGISLEVRAQDAAAARAVLEGEGEGEADAASPQALAEMSWEGVDRPPSEPAREEPARDEPGLPEALDWRELISILLVTCVYPIVADLTAGPDIRRIERGQMAAYIPWFAGLTLIVWVLLRRGPSALSPLPLPRSVTHWVREILVGAALFVGLWVFLDPLVDGVLRRMAIPDGPTAWSDFFRGRDVVAIFTLESFFAVACEEVVFRAYLISRLTLVLPRHAGLPVLAAAALCALMHGYPLRPALMVFVDAVAFGLVYRSSRSLPRLVTAHWLFDLASMRSYLQHVGS